MWFHPVCLIFSLTHTQKGTIRGVIGERCKNTNQTGFQKVRTSGPLWDEDLGTVPGTGFGNTVTYRLSLQGSSMAAITIGMCIYIMRSDRSWLADSVVFYFVCNSIPQELWEPSQVVLLESRIRMHFFQKHFGNKKHLFIGSSKSATCDCVEGSSNRYTTPSTPAPPPPPSPFHLRIKQIDSNGIPWILGAGSHFPFFTDLNGVFSADWNFRLGAWFIRTQPLCGICTMRETRVKHWFFFFFIKNHLTSVWRLCPI